MGLRLTRAGDYAIRAMVHVASLPDGAEATTAEIAGGGKIPETFAAKILRKLVRAGLLSSARGVGGGFTLAKPADSITLLALVEAIEGPIHLTDCVPDPEHCTLSHDCPASGVWLEVQRRMTGYLGEITLEAMVSAPRKNRRIVWPLGIQGAAGSDRI